MSDVFVENSAKGACVFYDNDNETFNLFLYEKDTDESSIGRDYRIMIFREGKVYTAASSSYGLCEFFKTEKLYNLKENTIEHLKEKMPSFTEQNYTDLMALADSNISISFSKS